MKRLLILIVIVAVLAGAVYFFVYRKKPESSHVQVPELLHHVPKNLAALAYVDFVALRGSPFWHKTVASIPPEKRDEEFNRFVVETGFDYERDLDEVVLAHCILAGSPALQLAIAEGRFDRARIRAYALRNGKSETHNGVEIFRFAQRNRPDVHLTFLSDTRLLLAQSEQAGEGYVRPLLQSLSSPKPFEGKMQQHVEEVAGASAFVVARIQPASRGTSTTSNFLDQLQDLRGSLDWLTLAARPDGDQLRILVQAESDGTWKAMQLGILLDGFKLIAQSALKNPQSDTGLSRKENEALLRLLENATTSRDGNRVQIRLAVTPDLVHLLFENEKSRPPVKKDRSSRSATPN